MTNDEGNENLSGAFALNALDDAEREAYKSALADSEELRNEATELQDTAVELGLAVAPVQPPDALRASILASVAVTPQLAAPLRARTAPDVAPATAATMTPAQTRAQTRAQRRWFQRPAAAIASMAAAVALIAGGVVVGSNLIQSPQNDQAALMSQIAGAPDSMQLEASVAGGGTATLVWSGELASAAVIFDNVKPAKANEVYQLWYIGEDGPRAAGILPSSDGEDAWRVLDGEMRAGDAVGVTIEPEGGSEQPTTDPVVVIEPA